MSLSVPETMLAAQCVSPGASLEICRVDVPMPASGELLVKMETCGICHSDVHLRDGDENLPDDLYPLILGHEGIGKVVAKGEHCESAPAIGTRVGLPWLFDSCLNCKPCLSGVETFCKAQNARGVTRHGAFAEFAIVDARFACEIPAKLDPVNAAPLICAGLTAWSALKKTRIAPGSRVLVVGAGGLGQYAVLIAKAYGAVVIVVDKDQSKLDNALLLGADEVYLKNEKTGLDVQHAGGADIALNFAPTPAVWPMIEQAVNPMGDVVAVALVHQPVDLSMMWLIDGGHRVFGTSVGTRQELKEFLTFAVDFPLPVAIEKIRFQDVDAGCNRLLDGDVRGRLCIDFSL